MDLKLYARQLCPPLIWSIASKFSKQVGLRSSALAIPEVADHYANTSVFAIEKLSKLAKLPDLKLFSLGCRIPHLADYIAIFKHTTHCTMVETVLPLTASCLQEKFSLLRQDFFSIEEEIEADCLISHATIHAMRDVRYGHSQDRFKTQADLPYKFAEKLIALTKGRHIPAIVSIAVSSTESLVELGGYLSHEKFVKSFEAVGYYLEDYYFDYHFGEGSATGPFMNSEYRRLRALPDEIGIELSRVNGTYFFVGSKVDDSRQGA